MLDLANPSPGDMLVAGGYMVQGNAFDPRSTPDNGIDKVSIFLDPRDSGGIPLGDVTPVEPGNPSSQFTATIQLPANHVGGHVLTVYAHSNVSDVENTTSVPISMEH